MLGISIGSVAWPDTQLLRETVDNHGRRIYGNVPMLGLCNVHSDHKEVTARMEFLDENWK